MPEKKGKSLSFLVPRNKTTVTIEFYKQTENISV